MKKVLIVSFYWPPAGGGGVQRISKFCKYLSRYGWEPIILTSRNASVDHEDPSLLKDVEDLRRVEKIEGWEPHTWFETLNKGRKSPRSKKGARKPEGWKQDLGEFVRLNVFVPDSRVGWNRPATRKGLDILREEKPDVVFSTSPPYTPHLVARKLSRAAGIPHVVDYRDPWLENHAYNRSYRFPWVKAWNRWLESRILEGAAAVTAANPRLARLAAEKLPPSVREKVVSISNGYDPDDIPESPYEDSGRFEVSYYGTVYEKGFPDMLFTTFADLCRENDSFARDAVFRFTGATAPGVRRRIEDAIPPHNLEFRDYIPHGEMLRELFAPRVLLMVVNEFPGNAATVPGKVYEYLATGNPVLGVGPVPGDAADVLTTGANTLMIQPKDEAKARKFYLETYQAREKNPCRKALPPDTRFSREHLTRQLAFLFTELTNQSAK